MAGPASSLRPARSANTACLYTALERTTALSLGEHLGALVRFLFVLRAEISVLINYVPAAHTHTPVTTPIASSVEGAANTSLSLTQLHATNKPRSRLEGRNDLRHRLCAIHACQLSVTQVAKVFDGQLHHDKGRGREEAKGVQVAILS